VRLALVAINPGRTRKLKIGKRRGGAAIVEIDRKTKRVLQAAAGGRAIPDYWIGVRFDQLPGLERALGKVAREHKGCQKWARGCEDLPGKKCPPATFRRKRDVLLALDRALEGKLRSGAGRASPYLDVLDPGAAQLGDLDQFADRRGRRKFRSWAEAVEWLAPRSRRWLDLDDMQLAEVSEKMREALAGQLDDVGGFAQLVPPLETEIARRKVSRRRLCDDRAGEETNDLIDQVRAALEELVEDAPF
jgi:hypothetical protein